MQVELLQNVLPVRDYCGGAQVEYRRDILVRSALSQQLEDLPLAISQKIVTIFYLLPFQLPDVIVSEHAADLGAKECLALRHRAHRLDGFQFRGTLEHVSPGTRF